MEINKIDMEKYASRLNNHMQNSNCKGAIIIWVIITIVVVSIMGSSMVYMTTGSTYEGLFANNQARVYYIAEAGGRFAIPQIAQDPVAAETNLGTQTFTLSGTEQFTLTIDAATNPTYTLLTSTGIINAGGWFEGQRTIRYEVLKPFSEPFGDDNNWNDPGGNAAVFSGGPGVSPTYGEAAFRFNGIDDAEGTTISLDWDGNTNLPDLAEIQAQSGLLSYELQVKSAIDLQGSRGDHFMVGLSFRLDNATAQNTYGISFFKSDPADTPLPVWVSTTVFNPIRDNQVYIVLWKEVSNVITLLDYKLLPLGVADVVYNGGPKLNIKNWSTLVVRIIEIDDGTRKNKISGYFQDAGVYARSSPISWDLSLFNEVVAWTITNPQPIEDITFTTGSFGATRPSEIGIHAFYDSGSNNDIFFDDFALRVLEDEVSAIQY